MPTLVSSRRGPKQTEAEARKAALYPPIGPLKVERDGLNKNVGDGR